MASLAFTCPRVGLSSATGFRAARAPVQTIGRPVTVRPTTRVPLEPVAFFGFGGGPKFDDSKKYICTDCGYIYDGRDPVSELPASYKCPVCTSPKKRFKAWSGSARSVKNDNKSMVARMKNKEW